MKHRAHLALLDQRGRANALLDGDGLISDVGGVNVPKTLQTPGGEPPAGVGIQRESSAGAHRRGSNRTVGIIQCAKEWRQAVGRQHGWRLDLHIARSRSPRVRRAIEPHQPPPLSWAAYSL